MVLPIWVGHGCPFRAGTWLYSQLIQAGTGCSRKGMAHLPGGWLALVLTSVVSELWISYHLKGPSMLLRHLGRVQRQKVKEGTASC